MRCDAVNEMADLGSGPGGPVALVAGDLNARGFRTSVTLTDLYPNRSALKFPDSIRYRPDPVDARRVPAELRGIRTMFASFHHFRPEAAHGILRSAFEQRRPIRIFEATARTPAGIVTALLIPLLGQAAVMGPDRVHLPDPDASARDLPGRLR